MARKKSGPLRNVGLKLPGRLWEAVEQLAEKNYRTMTAEVQMALEKHLNLEGMWPPAEERNGHDVVKGRK